MYRRVELRGRAGLLRLPTRQPPTVNKQPSLGDAMPFIVDSRLSPQSGSSLAAPAVLLNPMHRS